MRISMVGVAAFGVLACMTTAARADFSGQPILGPLTPGLSVAGTLVGKADDNDGFFSGTHIFDIWDGGDDVYSIVWGGGDLTVNLTSLGGSDADLFIYRPSDLDESSDYSPAGAFDTVTITGAAPGTYYAVVDTVAFGEGPYSIEVVAVPAPGSVGLLAAAGLMAGRRRR